MNVGQLVPLKIKLSYSILQKSSFQVENRADIFQTYMKTILLKFSVALTKVGWQIVSNRLHDDHFVDRHHLLFIHLCLHIISL